MHGERCSSGATTCLPAEIWDVDNKGVGWEGTQGDTGSGFVTMQLSHAPQPWALCSSGLAESFMYGFIFIFYSLHSGRFRLFQWQGGLAVLQMY